MRFSVVIPVYNVAPYLKECLDSLLAQEIQDWEAICVDDGSTDESSAILDEYARRDSRFRVIHQLNMGVGAARNTALDVVRGDWILSLDSDDILRQDALEQIDQVLSLGSGADIIRFGFTCFSHGSAPDWSQNFDEFSSSRTNGTVLDFSSYVDTRCLNSLNVLHAYRRELIADLRFKNYRNGEDVVFQTAAVVRAKEMVTIQASLYGYRCGRAGSACTTKRSERPTFRRVYDDIWSSYDALEILARCGKRHDQSRIHWLSVVMTEMTAYSILSIDRKNRSRAWREWYEALARCKCVALHILSPWARFVVRLNTWIRIPVLAAITCALPFYLKQHGIHR